MKITKRCATCTKFRAYDPDDTFCILCGHEPLEEACTCGRAFDYALTETRDVHCPKCGRKLTGRAMEFDG